MALFAGPGDLLSAVGTDLGVGPWVEVGQERIDAFADATGDRQWIHVDPVRAATGPFGTTIAHGFLVVSLLGELTAPLLEVPGAAMALNAGSDRIRFLTPVPSGSRIRARATLAAASTTSTGVRVELDLQVEVEGGTRPAVVARTLTIYVPAA